MTSLPDTVWLSCSPSLIFLDRPLIKYLAGHTSIAQWEYRSQLDEASSLDTAVALLHGYLQPLAHPVHLIGHGLSGVLGLLYAQRYPTWVRSLTLLSVSPQPATTWHTHYYVQRHLFTQSREWVVGQMMRSLFGQPICLPIQHLYQRLINDLEQSPCSHSLYRLTTIPAGGIDAPLLVCGSRTDAIVSPSSLYEWRHWFKPQDHLWQCEAGHHFFHYFYPKMTGEQILQFWQAQSYGSTIEHGVLRSIPQ